MSFPRHHWRIAVLLATALPLALIGLALAQPPGFPRPPVGPPGGMPRPPIGPMGPRGGLGPGLGFGRSRTYTCAKCGTTVTITRPIDDPDREAHCSKCGARDQMKTVKLSNTGTLYVYSIVCRSFPGIEVPYVSAVVDLDGGGTVKGNLINVEAVPEKIKLGMPVELVYKDALGRKDREGNSYISYFFQPRR